jgi:hypothetical protein
VILIALGDLAFPVLRLARSTPLVRRGLVPVENHLLRERHLGRDEMGALQLQRQEGMKVSRGRQALRRSTSRQRRIRHTEKTNNLQIFLPPCWKASGVAATVATSRSISRSPAPRSAGPRWMMGATVRSRSPPRGPCQSSSRRGEAVASRAARLFRRDIARSHPPG